MKPAATLRFVLLLRPLAVLLAADAPKPTPVIISELVASNLSVADFTGIRAGDSLILRIDDLDLPRQRNEPLLAQVDLAGKRKLAVDFEQPALSRALTI